MPKILCLTVHSDRAEAASLIGLRRAGFEITVMYPDGAPYRQEFIDGGLRVVTLTINGNIDRQAISAIRSEVREQRYDIVHTFSNRTITNALLATRGTGIPVVAYRGIVGNVGFLDPMSWLRYLHPRVVRIICVAEAIRQYFLDMRFLGYRMKSGKPVTIHKGHDLSWYRDPPADLRQLDIPADAFVVGCVANMRPRKGLPVLIAAAADLPADANIFFLLVGNMESDKLRQQIGASPFRDRIRIAGYRADAPELMAACNCIVLPALRREGLPKVIIEAMAYGTTPIVTDSGGSPELIIDGESGLLVPPGNAKAIATAIMRLFNNPDESSTLGTKARERIRNHFRVEDTVTKTAELYRDVLKHPG